MTYVYVLNKHGQPLMPCSPAKARHLLDQKKAIVKKRTPFTIQLLYGSTGYKQPIVLGVDAGSKTVGLSASTERKELFTAEMKPRNDIVDKLSTKRELRRSRRNRKTRYRPARFNNRKKTKKPGWIAPSIQVKIQEHITTINRICKLLPITKVIVETAEFDTQRLQAMIAGKPLPVGTDYQRGAQLDFYNVRQYVLHRDGYKCRKCGAHKDVKFHVHHLESRKTGGNSPDNLITLCETCHENYHKGLITLDKLKRRPSLRDATFMGIMRKTLITRLQNELNIPVIETKGYITKYTRENILKLNKTHINDALSIAHEFQGFDSLSNTQIARVNRTYTIKPIRHHNRQLHKTNFKNGKRKANQAPKYVCGFKLFDKVKYNGKECFINGRRTTGYFSLKTIDNKVITNSIHYRYLKPLEKSTEYLIA